MLRLFVSIEFVGNFGSVFYSGDGSARGVPAPYAEGSDATEEMAADGAIHGEIIRALATNGREARVISVRRFFGANDGLVSNLALIMGITASGASSSMVLLSGIAGLLAGALSMAAGEFDVGAFSSVSCWMHPADPGDPTCGG